MIRKQVYIEERQERFLKKTAGRLGIPEAELIRRGIDQSLAGMLGADADTAAWKNERKFIAKLRQRPLGRSGRRWNRDELHER